MPIKIDRDACAAFWGGYLEGLASDHPHRSRRPVVFGFGNEPALADELASLTLAGRKRATTSLHREYTALGEAIPQAGDVSIIVWGNGKPAALVETLWVETKPMSAVDAAYAALEGEGDGSLGYWRAAHRQYFREVCRGFGEPFDEDALVLCQALEVRLPATG